MINCKEFGIYTERNEIFIIIYTNNTTALGFSIPGSQFYDREISNKLINDWINSNWNSLTTHGIFKVNSKRSKLMEMWSYLGQIQDINLCNKIRNKIDELMDGKAEEWLNKD